MNAITLIIFVVALIASVIIVNKAQQLYMKLIGADGMFFSAKKKLIAIVIVASILAGIVYKLFGIA